MSVEKEELLNLKTELTEKLQALRAMSVEKEELLNLKIDLAEKLQALRETTRNDTLKLFGGLALLLSILSYFGMSFIAERQLEKTSLNSLIEKASEGVAIIQRYQKTASEGVAAIKKLQEPWKDSLCVLSPTFDKCPAGFTNRQNFYACFPKESTLGINATGMSCGGEYDDRHITVCCL